MTISTNNNTSLISALNGGSSASSVTEASINDVQNSFLKILTTQLQNQDPTNPLDNAQLTTQLAEMSTAQGISQLNTTLTNLLSSYQSAQTLQAASLIGHTVLADGNLIALSNSQGVGGVDLASAANDVTVQILDSSGQVVRTLDLGAQNAGQVGFTWDGTDDQGQTVADGTYQISVQATNSNGDVQATPLSLTNVSSVSMAGGTVKVNASGLGQIDLSQIYQIF